MKKLLLAIALALAAACSHGPEPFGRMTVEAVDARRAQANVFIFDNNSRATFDAGHVPGARWVDYQNIAASDLPANKEATLIFYCASDW